jgi:hypothetical protein
VRTSGALQVHQAEISSAEQERRRSALERAGFSSSAWRDSSVAAALPISQEVAAEQQRLLVATSIQHSDFDLRPGVAALLDPASAD